MRVAGICLLMLAAGAAPAGEQTFQVLGWQDVRLVSAERLAACSPAAATGRTPGAVPGASWRVVLPLNARVFGRPQKTLAHFGRGGRKCSTSS